PTLQKAAEWLVDKEVRIRGDWAINNSYPEASGWAFEYNNVYYADTDDTAMVLMALRLVKPGDSQSLNDLFRRALGWQLSFQCRDGGWAAFDKDVTTAWLEDMPFARTRLARDLPKQRRRLERDLWHIRKSINQRNWPKHCVTHRLGDYGHLRLRRSGSAECSTWFALPPSIAKARWLVG